jgi:Domain of unknown function (DUF1707)
MAGSEDAAAGQFRASHDERELAIEVLKDAFAYGRLTTDEFGARIDRALRARFAAELAALTADVPASPALAKPRPPRPVRSRPLLKAAAGSGACLVSAFALVLLAANVLDPAGLGNPNQPWSSLCLLLAITLVGVGFSIAVVGAAVSVEQWVSRKQSRSRRASLGRVNVLSVPIRHGS